MSRVLDQQFVAHLFAPAEGPDADAAYQALNEIWRGCGLLFGMTGSIPGTGLPSGLPVAREAMPADGEHALAAREHPGANCQAVLRLHRDVFNLSVGLEPPEGVTADRPRWRAIDYQWDLLTTRHAGHLLGEARLYLARVDAEAEIRGASGSVYLELSRLLPSGVSGPRGQSAGVAAPGPLALWETGVEPDERALRRFVLAIAPDADAAASAWVWSGGDVVIPPLARYLLHAAKLRYELRVWQRDSQSRQLQATLDSLGTELRRLDASDPVREAEEDHLEKAALLRRRRRDAMLLHAELRALRHTVEIATDNLGRAFDLSGLLAAGTPFADDADLARSLLERLDDEIAYLGLAAERAELTWPRPAATQNVPATQNVVPATQNVPAAQPTLADELRRNVFVIYGRDEPARRAIFDFLRALDLRPLEWEALVRGTGNTAPFLSEAVRKGLALAPAVVVLMTPEDVVYLHPELHEPREKEAETQATLQARPNVLLELGMALAAKPAGTLVLMIGEHRPVTDLGGLNFIQVIDTPQCRRKIAGRLRQAGCLVDDTGNDWLTAGDFANLAALHRTP